MFILNLDKLLSVIFMALLVIIALKINYFSFFKRQIGFYLKNSNRSLFLKVLVFTDGSSNGKAVVVSNKGQQLIYTNCNSTQEAKLVAVLTALKNFSGPLNIVSDSAYVVHTVQNIETAPLSHNPNLSLQILFTQLQQVVRNRQHPFFIAHIRAHTSLPGPMTHGNALADSLIVHVAEATQFHLLTHINTGGLQTRFPTTYKQAA